MADNFPTDSVLAQARSVVTVTPNDSADLTDIPKALWIAGAGTLTICGASDASNTGVSMGNLAVGTLVPVRARRVKATGTGATVVALY